MNKQFNSTIIMVTHDPSASFAQRVIMLKDGDIHSEILQQSKTKSKFYNEIIQLQSPRWWQMTFNQITLKNLKVISNIMYYIFFINLKYHLIF